MDKKLDDAITKALSDIASISPSKNIGESAIEIIKNNKRNVNLKPNITMKRAMVIAVCIISISISGALVFSEEIANTVTNIKKLIYTVQKNGETYTIAKVDASTNNDNTNLGGVSTDDFSKDELANKLGFEPYVPLKIGNHERKKSTVGIKLNGLSSELNTIDKDSALESIKSDDKFKKNGEI